MGNILLAINEPLARDASLLLSRTAGRPVPISLEAITTIEARGDCSVVHTVEGHFISPESLATLEKALPASAFARLNHSVILNISQIEELQVLGVGGNHVLMTDGRIIALTPQLSEMESLLRHAAS